jgi:hypothetical protein
LEKVANSVDKYVIKATTANKYLSPKGSEVTLSDQKHPWVIEEVGAPGTFYT